MEKLPTAPTEVLDERLTALESQVCVTLKASSFLGVGESTLLRLLLDNFEYLIYIFIRTRSRSFISFLWTLNFSCDSHLCTRTISLRFPPLYSHNLLAICFFFFFTCIVWTRTQFACDRFYHVYLSLEHLLVKICMCVWFTYTASRLIWVKRVYSCYK